MNPYMIRATKRYEALQAGIESLQTRAAAEDRDMTADELRAAQGQADEAKKIYAEIALMSEAEKANAAVRSLGGQIREAASAAQIGDAGNGNLRVSDRDPGHYRSAVVGGKVVATGRSWFADLYAATREDNADAMRRIRETSAFANQVRTGDTTATVPGVVQPTYFTDLFTQMMQQQAVLASLAPSYPISSANPFYLPGQTALTTEVDHTTENVAVTSSDSYAATYASGSPITPTVLTAKETLSRELLDGSNPAVDSLILADFARTLAQTKENKIGVAIRAITAGAQTTTQALWETMTTSGTNAWDEIVTAVTAVRSTLFERPDAIVVDYDMFGGLLKLKDSTGRPLLVMPEQGPMNALGQANLQNDGWLSGVPVYVSNGIKGGTSTTWYAAVLKSAYVQQFESPMLSFRYEEVAGPQSIQLGVWQYYAVATRQGNRAVRNLTATLT